jgi:hypothetical protein
LLHRKQQAVNWRVVFYVSLWLYGKKNINLFDDL